MATNTYIALKTTTVTGSAVSSVTLDLTGITGYTDLVLVGQTQSDGGSFGNLSMRFNSDTTANYSRLIMYGTGSTAGTAKSSASTDTSIALNTMPTTSQGYWAMVRVNIMNYSNTTTLKTVLSRGDLLNDGTLALVGLWRKTPEAITSITLFSTVGNIAVGSTFTVYGIANADNFVKATGGIITEDATYTYHTFGSSGTFTPKQTLSVDYLVVAGGGGGGGGTYGGGGGAGGARYSTGLSVSTAQTVTVGSGGATTTNGTASSFGSIAASGGGGGGSNESNGKNGGSGGGGSGTQSGTIYGGSGNTGSYSPVEGYGGGNGIGVGTNGGPCGGGGGAGGAGTNSSGYNSGNGGDGITWLDGNSYAGGGGGGSFGSQGILGTGKAGGGNGVAGGNTPYAARPYTGSGGGGGGATGGTGGSGIVIVRYAK